MKDMAEYQREWAKQKRLKAIETKTCIKCGKQDERTLAGRRKCTECQKLENERVYARRKYRKEHKQCIYCAEVDRDTLGGKKLCRRCAIYYSNRNLEAYCRRKNKKV